MKDAERLRIVKSDKYLDWIVEFTDFTATKSWDDETACYAKCGFSEYDMNNVILFGTFIQYVLDLAKDQYVVSLPHNKYTDYRYNFQLRNNFYEISRVGDGCINVIKKITQPEGKPIYIDEKIDPKEKKDREFVQYILVNKDIEVPASVFAVHIAHACTICAMKESKKPAYDVWYNDKQKIVILDASQEKMEELEMVAYGIRDTGHNDIPKNSLIALSLGIIPKAKALLLTKGCTLHKDK